MRAWRRSRPFWGGLLTVLAGVELISLPFSLDALPLIVHSVEAGLAYLLSITMIVLGVLIVFQPAQRVFLGVVAILLSIASVVYVNVGGFLLGMVLGLLGGALTAAWTPVPHDPAAAVPQDAPGAPPAGPEVPDPRKEPAAGADS
ncbi:DUF6114 domain-containing protein [Sphaerisporangium sp. NPDC005288]|uniref:DUF6114 domain-containing protein n=1 Tax=Sphaerisporangium sp. NPDC005288 TaxID=3155114 RepID=UPI0033ADA26A